MCKSWIRLCFPSARASFDLSGHPIFPPHQCYICCTVGVQHYQPAFGLSTAPQVFPNMLSRVLALLWGHTLVNSLVDYPNHFLLKKQSVQTLPANVQWTMQTLLSRSYLTICFCSSRCSTFWQNGASRPSLLDHLMDLIGKNKICAATVDLWSSTRPGKIPSPDYLHTSLSGSVGVLNILRVYSTWLLKKAHYRGTQDNQVVPSSLDLLKVLQGHSNRIYSDNQSLEYSSMVSLPIFSWMMT